MIAGVSAIGGSIAAALGGMGVSGGAFLPSSLPPGCRVEVVVEAEGSNEFLGIVRRETVVCAEPPGDRGNLDEEVPSSRRVNGSTPFGSSRAEIGDLNSPFRNQACVGDTLRCEAAEVYCRNEYEDRYRGGVQIVTTRGGGVYEGYDCNQLPEEGEPADAPEPPPVPTLGQIQQAFAQLPFSKPSPSIQPPKLKTLINLETFYAAEWPDDAGLQPGEVSEPQKLLSVEVQFRVAPQAYRFNFGDGATSGWTSSTGGTYPDGDITHTYTKTRMAKVSVDSRLTGQYRVDGGPWQDIDFVADLEDEPVVTLEVAQAKNRLVR